jgi:hypothetical protein
MSAKPTYNEWLIPVSRVDMVAKMETGGNIMSYAIFPIKSEVQNICLLLF